MCLDLSTGVGSSLSNFCICIFYFLFSLQEERVHPVTLTLVILQVWAQGTSHTSQGCSAI
jgi:hypothetical protein